MGKAGRVAAYGAFLLAASWDASAADRGFYFGAFGGQAKYDFERVSPLLSGIVPTGNAGFPVLSINFTPRPGTLPYDPIFVAGGLAAVDADSFSTFYPVTTTQWRPEDDDKSTAWGIVAGYRIMRYAAVELNYQNLGKLQETQATLTLVPSPVPSPTSPVYVLAPAESKRELETSGPSVSALGILPIVDHWSVYARAGVFFADMKFTSSVGNGGDRSITFGSESFLWGAGTQFDFGSHWSVRADFQRFDSVGEKNGSGRADIDLLSLGVIFRL